MDPASQVDAIFHRPPELARQFAKTNPSLHTGRPDIRLLSCSSDGRSQNCTNEPKRTGTRPSGPLPRPQSSVFRRPECYNEILRFSSGTWLLRTDSLIAAAGRWFLQSGIQEPNGGVARYYRSDLRKNAAVSTEITGYSISALLFFYERTGNSEYLDRALRAARFLTRTAWDQALGIFPFEHGVTGAQSGGFAYFFDCGIIARALLATWRATGEAEFRDAAVATGRAMLADFCSSEAIHPILALPNKSPLPYQPRWSASPGCYQLKSAMAWFELFECTGETDFLRAYGRALDAAFANEPSFLPATPTAKP